jgi:hypothetical protein
VRVIFWELCAERKVGNASLGSSERKGFFVRNFKPVLLKENSVVALTEENNRFSVTFISFFGTSCDASDAQSSSRL